MGQPRPLSSFIYCVFKETLQFLQQLNVKIYPSSIWCQDSNLQPSDHESPPALNFGHYSVTPLIKNVSVLLSDHNYSNNLDCLNNVYLTFKDWFEVIQVLAFSAVHRWMIKATKLRLFKQPLRIVNAMTYFFWRPKFTKILRVSPCKMLLTCLLHDYTNWFFMKKSY